jgi:RimJ/RimL family protein N-acetyltransferase
MPDAPPMAVEPVVLEGRHVRLEPLAESHVEPLAAVSLDPELWRWTVSQLHSVDDLRAYVEEALALQRDGSALPFATIDRASGRVVGSTRFGNIDRTHRRVEIGWTFVARPWQRSAINTEAKYLMLRHAFESLGCRRVELKTDALNARSRAAILRIGAVEEGTLRKHMVTAGGRARDTVYFSVVDDEWPAVRARLEAMLAR